MVKILNYINISREGPACELTRARHSLPKFVAECRMRNAETSRARERYNRTQLTNLASLVNVASCLIIMLLQNNTK